MKHFILALSFIGALLFNGCSSGPVPTGAPEKVKTYLIGAYEDSNTVSEKLKSVGFEVVATVDVDDAQTIVFINDHIKALANRPMRGLLAGEMRIFVNKEANEIRVNNPLYFVKAFLQDEYKEGDEQPIVEALMKAFPSLKADVMEDQAGQMLDTNADLVAYGTLPEYHYMIGMPYYNDQNVVGEAASVEELVKQLKKKAKKNLRYLIELAPNRFVAGVDLGKRTAKFPKKIGTNKAGLLPWQILIEEIEVDGKKTAKATTLDGKYRIALSYPLLSMVGEGSFAGIMTVPGAIEKDMSKFFK